MAGYIKEKILHKSQQIHSQEDDSIILLVKISGTEELKSWVMSWGSTAEVLELISLRDMIHGVGTLDRKIHAEQSNKDRRPPSLTQNKR